MIEDENVDERRRRILESIDLAIPDDSSASTDISNIFDVQDTLDVLWELLDLHKTPNATVTGPKTRRQLPLRALRKVALELTVYHNKLPRSFYLHGVKYIYSEGLVSGSIANLYSGEYQGRKVALKLLRSLQDQEQNKEKNQRDLRRASMLWRGLIHPHILPFLGVSEDAFRYSLCMILPWLENGNIRDYMRTLRRNGELSGRDHVYHVDQWMYEIATGLSYLHDEGVVHGDLHGANILIDDNGHVCLTDFGFGVLTEATVTPRNYGSNSTGGGFQYLAPEIYNPDDFDLENARPTPASDIYALACVCVELYTEQVPFVNVELLHMVRAVLRGKRPPKPSTVDGEEIGTALWKLIQRCWAHQPSDRPSASEVVRVLAAIVRDSAPAQSVSGKSRAPPDQDISEAAPASTPPELRGHSLVDLQIASPQPQITQLSSIPTIAVTDLTLHSQKKSQSGPSDLPANSAHTSDLSLEVVQHNQENLGLPGTAPKPHAHATSTASRYERIPSAVINSQPARTMLPSPERSSTSTNHSQRNVPRSMPVSPDDPDGDKKGSSSMVNGVYPPRDRVQIQTNNDEQSVWCCFSCRC